MPIDLDKSATVYCSFCGKSQYEVRMLVAGPQSFICNECVEMCVEICVERVHEDQANRLAKRIAKPVIAVMRFLRWNHKAQRG